MNKNFMVYSRYVYPCIYVLKSYDKRECMSYKNQIKSVTNKTSYAYLVDNCSTCICHACEEKNIGIL